MTRFPIASRVADGYSETDGSAPRVCALARSDTLPWASDASVSSVYELFRLGVDLGKSRRCLGHRPMNTDYSSKDYQWVTYGEVATNVLAIARGMRVSIGTRVGIFGSNSPNWIRIQIAASAAGACLVTLYSSLGPDAIEYITKHAELSLVFVSEDNLQTFLDVWPRLPLVTRVVVFGRCHMHELANPNLIAAVRPPHHSAELIALVTLALEGSRPDSPALTYEPKPDDVFIIMYTSGTTGNPKGVMLRNRNFVASVALGRLFNDASEVGYDKHTVFFSLLPLAHIFAQQLEMSLLSGGACIGYSSGNVKNLVSDLDALEPTLFAGVPRVYARFEQKISAALEEANFLKRALFRYAFNTQLYNVQSGLPRSTLWDTLIFNKIRAKIFPQLTIAITGGAPMSASTNDFLKVCLNIPLVQGYGLTETVAGVLCSAPLRSRSGSCGGVLPRSQVKLVDVSDMGYCTSDEPRPRGEVHISGESVMLGYYKNDEDTKKAFPNDDGWFATGDIGAWNEDGTLSIIDRRKNLFKLAQGEYVSPEKLEAEYAKAPLVGQIFVYGNSFESKLVAVVVPDIPEAMKWARAGGYAEELGEIVKIKEFKTQILSEIETMRKQCGFVGYERVADVIVEIEGINELGQGFNVDNDMMTPTMKLKRSKVAQAYKLKIEQLYENINK